MGMTPIKLLQEYVVSFKSPRSYSDNNVANNYIMKDMSRILHTGTMVLGTILLTMLIGILDIVTTSQYRLFFFYILPVIIASFYMNICYSFFLSWVSTLFILVSVYVDHHALHIKHFWNAGIMLIIFSSISYFSRLLHRIRSIEKEKAFIEEKNIILDTSLKEKEMLIRETNHRMKNNLSMISSLIKLSAGVDREKMIMNLTNRIQAFSILYEKLSYSSNENAKIMLQGYLEDIVDLIIETDDRARDQISYAIAGADFYVALKSASLLGLIINELATNSIQHAFRNMEGVPKAIKVIFSEGYPGLIMACSDNRPDFNFYNKAEVGNHVGFLLLNSISKQLGGEVRYRGGWLGIYHNLSRFSLDY